VPVTIGGMVVSPGDIVIGDEDGVVAFPQAIATELLSAVRTQEAKEAEILRASARAVIRGRTRRRGHENYPAMRTTAIFVSSSRGEKRRSNPDLLLGAGLLRFARNDGRDESEL
jgi:Aldolase/RraA